MTPRVAALHVSWGYSYDDMLASADDDRSLARQAQAGAGAAFDELVRRYQRKVYRVAFGILRSTHDADDAVQEAFIRAYRYLPSLDPARSFEGWLMGIAVNQARTLRSRRRVVTGDTARVVVSDKAPQDGETHTAALQAVAALPEKQREA